MASLLIENESNATMFVNCYLGYELIYNWISIDVWAPIQCSHIDIVG